MLTWFALALAGGAAAVALAWGCAGPTSWVVLQATDGWGRLPEAWLAPPAVRGLRELVRYRAKLVALRGPHLIEPARLRPHRSMPPGAAKG